VATDWTPGRIALVVHPTRKIDTPIATINRWADEHGVGVVQLAVEGDGNRELAEPGTAGDGDLVVAVGGDGTVLSALRAAAMIDAPVLGVACGSLGVLTAVPAPELEAALERVCTGDWIRRMLPGLAIHPSEGPDDWAANDFVVERSRTGQVIVELSADDELYVRMAGDGFIVATPLGSSAYSMAAGGPVLAYRTAAFVCTPISMHGGNAPPLVVPADARVTLNVEPSYAGFDIAIDGHTRDLQADSYRIELHQDKLGLVSFERPGLGITSLRSRRLITDGPRILARDDRERR
jgi:NAD+ kinase